MDPLLISFLLDDSGSMMSIQDGTISGFNEYLISQQNQPAQTLFSLYKFADPGSLKAVYDCEDIAKIAPLHKDTYMPNGMSTALFDAIMGMLDEVEIAYAKTALQLGQDPRVLVVIMTDGEENASRSHTREDVFTRIKQLTDDKSWQFVYLGANQDAYKVGVGLGVSGGSTLTYAGTSQGTKQAMNRLSTSTLGYRSQDTRTIQSFFVAENTEEEDAED